MKRRLLIILSLLAVLLSGCGRYSESDMKYIKEEAREAGYKEGKMESDAAVYREGYDDGCEATMDQIRVQASSSEADQLLGRIEHALEDVVYAMYYDGDALTSDEIEDKLTWAYTAVVKYNESH